MDLSQDLEYVRSLAKQKKEYDLQIEDLKNKLQQNRGFVHQEVSKKIVPVWIKWCVFCLSEILFGLLISKALSYLLTIFANAGMSRQEFRAAGYAGYHIYTVPWLIGAVFAIPISIFLFLLVRRVIKSKNMSIDQDNIEKQVEEQKMNAEIAATNDRIREYNESLLKQIEAVKAKKMELEDKVLQDAAWYPVAYFSIEAVEFAMQELQTGRANTIEEALTHFEIKGGK